MFPDTYLFSICMILIGLVLFLLIYFVLILSDVECDYINAQQCCTKLNIWMIPKVATHGVVTILLLLTGHWMLFLCNVPFLSYLIWELWKVPRGNIGVFDPAEIYNRGMIKRHLRETMIYLGFYLIIFFMYLYCMIRAILKDDPIKRHLDDEIVTDL